jgi:poly(hydroxyalkanoate) depolymerase family esterase
LRPGRTLLQCAASFEANLIACKTLVGAASLSAAHHEIVTKELDVNPNRMRTLSFLALSQILVVTAKARGATLQKVSQSDWQGGTSLPSYVNMYIYVPDNPAAKPPILVASHHCQGNGTQTYNETKSTFVSQADKNGYIIIFPEATGHNCWDVGSEKALKHDGGGDTHAIAQMVRYAIAKYGANASRIYAFGGSSGGMMTQALLGVYPDIFTAGVAVSGVPCGCWSVGYSGDVASNGQWSGACAGGSVTKTGQQWGELVRSMFPGYTGHRARVQLWHGDPDGTISFVNFDEAIKEWTNVLNLSSTPTKKELTNASTTHQTWSSACGFKVLETFAIQGAGHSVQWDLATASSFLGLDKAGGQDPEYVACGSGGATGTGGTTSGGLGSSGGTSPQGGSAGYANTSTGSTGRAGAGPSAPKGPPVIPRLSPYQEPRSTALRTVTEAVARIAPVLRMHAAAQLKVPTIHLRLAASPKAAVRLL